MEAFVTKLENNNMKLVFRKDTGERELMSFVCVLTNNWRMCCDVIFEKATKSVNIQLTVPE